MRRDVKEVVGILMRVLGGGDVSREEIEELTFEATGALEVALNEAYIKLLEFAYDREARSADTQLDATMRSGLQPCLEKIAQLCERD